MTTMDEKRRSLGGREMSQEERKEFPRKFIGRESFSFNLPDSRGFQKNVQVVPMQEGDKSSRKGKRNKQF